MNLCVLQARPSFKHWVQARAFYGIRSDLATHKNWTRRDVHAQLVIATVRKHGVVATAQGSGERMEKGHQLAKNHFRAQSEAAAAATAAARTHRHGTSLHHRIFPPSTHTHTLSLCFPYNNMTQSMRLCRHAALGKVRGVLGFPGLLFSHALTFSPASLLPGCWRKKCTDNGFFETH